MKQIIEMVYIYTDQMMWFVIRMVILLGLVELTCGGEALTRFPPDKTEAGNTQSDLEVAESVSNSITDIVDSIGGNNIFSIGISIPFRLAGIFIKMTHGPFESAELKEIKTLKSYMVIMNENLIILDRNVERKTHAVMWEITKLSSNAHLKTLNHLIKLTMDLTNATTENLRMEIITKIDSLCDSNNICEKHLESFIDGYSSDSESFPNNIPDKLTNVVRGDCNAVFEHLQWAYIKITMGMSSFLAYHERSYPLQHETVASKFRALFANVQTSVINHMERCQQKAPQFIETDMEQHKEDKIFELQKFLEEKFDWLEFLCISNKKTIVKQGISPLSVTCFYQDKNDDELVYKKEQRIAKQWLKKEFKDLVINNECDGKEWSKTNDLTCFCDEFDATLAKYAGRYWGVFCWEMGKAMPVPDTDQYLCARNEKRLEACFLLTSFEYYDKDWASSGIRINSVHYVIFLLNMVLLLKL